MHLDHTRFALVIAHIKHLLRKDTRSAFQDTWLCLMLCGYVMHADTDRKPQRHCGFLQCPCVCVLIYVILLDNSVPLNGCLRRPHSHGQLLRPCCTVWWQSSGNARGTHSSVDHFRYRTMFVVSLQALMDLDSVGDI